MDLPDTWDNYKSLLAIIASNDENSIKDFLVRLCSPVENYNDSRKLTELFAMAVAFKNCEIVSVLLQHGVRGRPCDELFKHTPMQSAVISGNVSLILEMVQCGVSCDDVDNDGNTLLHLAIVRKNERWENVDVNCSRQSIKSETDKDVAGTMKILLDLNLNVDAENNRGDTPLSLSVRYRMRMVTELLVERNASPKVFGRSVAHFLIMDEVEDSCDGQWNKQQKRDFMDWWFSKKIDINNPSNGETPLQLCARHILKNVLEILLKYTDEIHEVDAVGRTLLHILFRSVENSLRAEGETKCDIEKTIDIVKTLLDRGISVDETDKGGNTPFHVAARLKQPALMHTILGRFTNLNARNNMRENALHIVTKNYDDEYAMVYLGIICDLLNKGIDCNARNIYGWTPLHFVCTKISKYSKTIVQFFIQRRCNLSIKDECGVTPLHLAIRAKNTAIVEILINNGANVNCCEKLSNSTPLHEATRNNFTDVVEWLLKAGANTDVRDINGQTPLHIAVSDKSLKSGIMSLLLMFGADVEVVDKENKTPLHAAFSVGEPIYKRIEMLLDFGARVNSFNRCRLLPSRGESRRFNEKTLLIKHLVAQTVAGLFVRDCYAAVVQRAQREFVDFYPQCLQELDSLKTTTIDDVAVYDLLRMNLKRRYGYATKATFMGFLTDYEYLRNKFPVYRHIISASYWTAVRRKPLLDSAKLVWHQLTNVSLPEYCVELILDYLENSDLKFMIEAGA